jgi:uroporphyrin-III C-methyltransferase
MSKQTNEQDEKKAPSGKGQGGKGRQAGAGKKPGNAAGQGREPGGGQAPKPSAGGQVTDKSPAAASGSAVSSEKSDAAGDKAASPEAKPAPADSKAQGADKQAPVKPESAKPEDTKADSTKPEPGKTEAAKPAAAEEPASADKPTASGKPGSASSGPAGPGDSAKAVPPGGGAAVPPASSGGKGGGRGLGVLALILVLFLGIGAGLFAWNAWDRLDAQQARLAELEERAAGAAAADDVASLREELERGEEARNADMAEAIESMRSEFAGYRSEVDDALDQVLDELSRQQEPDEREWLHAEAAYLLRLANQRLQLERDVEGAAALLRTADARLSEAENPALLSVRRAIASELSILAGVPQVDRTGIYMALNAQQQRLAQLPLSRELEEIPARSGIEEAPTGGWQEQLSRFGQELRDLVVIRHHDQALETLVTPEQESYLRQSARLVIEQAQLALLKEEQELYEASIDKALALIEGYYDTERSEVQGVIEQLQALKGENIRPELPDISGSHQALAEFIERRFGSRGDRGDEA